MARTVVPVSDAEYAAIKAEIAARCVTATVTGDQPIRDSISRESVTKGSAVRLDPEVVNLDALVSARAITMAPAAKATAGS